MTSSARQAKGEIAESMRAMALTAIGGPEHIAELEFPLPPLRGDEVLIRVHTVAANHQDVFTMTGRARNAEPTLPHIMGIDPSGVVSRVGPGVRRLTPGQRVVVKPAISCGECRLCAAGIDDSCLDLRNVGVHRPGGHAEYVAVPERNVFTIPAELGYESATAVAHSFPVALQMLERVEAGEDDVVLVTGAGGAIGSAAVQLAKSRGSFVIGAAGSVARTQVAEEMGANVTVDYGSEPAFSKRVRSIAPDRVSVYVEPASDPSIWKEALATLGSRARVVVCGAHAGPVVELDNSWLFRSRVAIYGSSGSTLRGMKTVLELAAAGRITPNIDSVRPIREIRDAYEDLILRRNVGKSVLSVIDGW